MAQPSQSSPIYVYKVCRPDEVKNNMIYANDQEHPEIARLTLDEVIRILPDCVEEGSTYRSHHLSIPHIIMNFSITIDKYLMRRRNVRVVRIDIAKAWFARRY